MPVDVLLVGRNELIVEGATQADDVGEAFVGGAKVHAPFLSCRFDGVVVHLAAEASVGPGKTTMS